MEDTSFGTLSLSLLRFGDLNRKVGPKMPETTLIGTECRLTRSMTRDEARLAISGRGNSTSALQPNEARGLCH